MESNMNDVGDEITAAPSAWNFGGKVPHSFDAHARRSIPFYEEGHDLIIKISDYFLAEGGVAYELGTSTGELLCKLARHNQNASLRLTGVDREAAMLSVAREKCGNEDRIQFVSDDLLTVPLEPCDFVISYYTMQFVRPAFRQALFNRIFESLNWGGGFLLFEKVRASDARFQDMMNGIYTDYKLNQGYTGNEIVSKSRSLKGILEPFSTRGNYELLERAGFKDIMTVMKWVSFEGILAIK